MIVPRPLAIAAVICAAVLNGCERVDRTACSPIESEAAAEHDYLHDVDKEAPQMAAFKRQQYAKFCVQKWGYTLGSVGASADNVIAEAVLGACQEPLKGLVEAERRRDSNNGDIALGVDSVLTGERVTREIAVQTRFRQIALFYVVQGRAGRCSVPLK
jgi:hypothetical protein